MQRVALLASRMGFQLKFATPEKTGLLRQMTQNNRMAMDAAHAKNAAGNPLSFDVLYMLRIKNGANITPMVMMQFG